MTTTHHTATAPSAGHTPPGALERIVNVAKLHLVNRSAVIWLPLFILSVIFTFTLILWWIIAVLIDRAGEEVAEATFVGGAAGFLVIYMLVVAVQAINLTFPFAQGYSVTRRDFYLGSALAFVGLSLLWAALMGTLAIIESVTGGWGLGGYLFSLGYLGVDTVLGTYYVYFMALLFFFFTGMAVASMYVRWKAWGLMGFFAGLALLLIGLVVLATFTDSWPTVGAWLVQNGAVGVAAWSIVPTLLAAVTGFFILRRATPK